MEIICLKFSKGPSTISAYQAYCINYKATMEYLGSIREKDERFTEFERVDFIHFCRANQHSLMD